MGRREASRARRQSAKAICCPAWPDYSQPLSLLLRWTQRENFCINSRKTMQASLHIVYATLLPLLPQLLGSSLPSSSLCKENLRRKLQLLQMGCQAFRTSLHRVGTSLLFLWISKERSEQQRNERLSLDTSSQRLSFFSRKRGSVRAQTLASRVLRCSALNAFFQSMSRRGAVFLTRANSLLFRHSLSSTASGKWRGEKFRLKFK